MKPLILDSELGPRGLAYFERKAREAAERMKAATAAETDPRTKRVYAKYARRHAQRAEKLAAMRRATAR